MAEQFNEGEQRLLNQIYAYSAEIVHIKASDSIVQRLQAGPDPIETIAALAAELTKTVEQVVEDSLNQELPEGIVADAGRNMVNELVDISLAIGLFDEKQAEEIGSNAFIEATRIYAEQVAQEGGISQQKRDASNRDLAMLMPQGQQSAAQPAAQPMPAAATEEPGMLNQ